jgi:tetratricopeptide (TPR) repeat protein
MYQVAIVKFLLLVSIVSSPATANSADDTAQKPASVVQALEAAQKLMLKGDYQDAINVLKEEPERSRHPEILSTLAKAFLLCGDYEDAAPVIETIRLQSHDSNTTSLLCEWEWLHGRTDVAIDMMKTMVEKMRMSDEDILNIASARASLGELLLSAGKLKEAETEFRAVIGMIDEEHARLHQLDVPHDHARYFSPEATVGLAKIYRATGQVNRSQRLWKSIRNRLSKPEHLAQSGYAALASGSSADAERSFEASIRKATDSATDANVIIAIAIAREESPATILRKTEACLERSRDIETLMNHAYALSLNERHDEAAKTMRQALRLGTKDARFDCLAGLIHEAAGERDKATERFEAALAANPAFDPVLSARARAFLDKSKASTRWK